MAIFERNLSNLSELLVLPAVDGDVAAWVEDKEEVGHQSQEVAPQHDILALRLSHRLNIGSGCQYFEHTNLLFFTMWASQHRHQVVPPWRLRRCWWESSPNNHVLYGRLYCRNKSLPIDYIFRECHLRCFEFRITRHKTSHTHTNYQVAASKDGDDKNKKGSDLLVAFLSHTRVLASVSRILIGNCFWIMTYPIAFGKIKVES